MSVTESALQLSAADAEAFLAYEAALLDEKRFREWLDLFTEDGLYWVPGDRHDADPATETSIIHDDSQTREMRVRRFESQANWSQEPASRTLHCISNVRVESVEKDHVVVRSNLVIYEVRLEDTNVLPATCEHGLRYVNGEWKIALRKVCLLASDQYLFNLSFAI